MVRRGVDGHRAPAAADVEQPPAGPLVEPELAADQLVLGGLGVGEVHAGVGEPGARVRHRRPEHEPVEVVADVVVVADGLGVAPQRVAPALAGGPPRAAVGSGAAEQAELARRPRRRPGRPSRPKRMSSGVTSRSDGDQLEEVAVDVEVAGDVGPRRGRARSGSTGSARRASAERTCSVPGAVGRARRRCRPRTARAAVARARGGSGRGGRRRRRPVRRAPRRDRSGRLVTVDIVPPISGERGSGRRT